MFGVCVVVFGVDCVGELLVVWWFFEWGVVGCCRGWCVFCV